MSDLPPDLDRLRTLETWLTLSLARVRQQITAEEQRLAELAARRPPPRPPDFELELNLARAPVRVHVGGCTMGGKGMRARALDRSGALEALGPGLLEPCPYCRPDAALRVLD